MRIFTALAAALFMAWFSAGSAMAGEQFVVIHVEPPVPDMVAGAVYRSTEGEPEFVFVPPGVKAVLMDEGGATYVVEGMAAVEASHRGLDEFRLPRGEGDDGGLFKLVFGNDNLAEITAANRKIPGAAQSSSETDDVAARLPLDIRLLAELGKSGNFCVFSDAVVFRRLDIRFLDRVHLEIGSHALDEDWKPDERELRFVGLGIGENEKAKARIVTKLAENEVSILRLPASTLGDDAIANARVLADHGCTIQAMMVAQGIAPKG